MKNYLILSCCLLMFLGCKKKQEDPSPQKSIMPPAPNSTGKTKYTTHEKSFDLSKDLFKPGIAISLTNQYPGNVKHLWLFKDLLISRIADPVVTFDEAGVIPVTHIVYINDSTQNVFYDTLYIGYLYANKYRVTASTLSNIYMKLLTNGYILQSFKVNGTPANVPYGMYTYSSRVYTDVVEFQVCGSDDSVLLSNTVDLTRINKIATSEVSGKILCINETGNQIWVEFSLLKN